MKQRLTRRRLGDIAEDRTDWSKVDAQSEDELAISIERDPDDQELRSDWQRHAILLRPGQPKERITMMIDADVLAWFRSHGRGYQTRLNAVLRAYYEAARRN